jgi:hypothetical protein
LDEVFLSSILCDFGQLILAEAAANQYRPVLKRAEKPGASLQQIERELLGADHGEIGGELLSEWGLPPLICDAIKYHHTPDHDALADEDARLVARVLEVASIVGDLYTGTEITAGIGSLQAAANQYFEMDANACHELLESTEASMAEVVEMLGLECNDPMEIAEIRMQATEHLVKQSMVLNQQIEAVSADSAELKKRNVALEERAAGEDNIACRYGGEEIAIIAPETDFAKLSALAEKLRTAVARISVTHGGMPVRRTVSIGGFAHPAGRTPPDPNRMIDLVDEQLYRAKSEGRNRVFIVGE